MARKIKSPSISLGSGDFWGFTPRTFKLIPDDLFLGILIILVAFASFGLGRLSKIADTKTPIRIENMPEVDSETFKQGTKPTTIDSNAQAASVIGATQGQLVGSKNGTKYHYPWCAGAQKISETNRIYFNSKAEAENAGYTPASNCKGL